MRKYISIVIMLLSALHSVAGNKISRLSDLKNTMAYSLTCERGFVVYNPALPNRLCGSNGTSFSTKPTRSLDDVNQQFQIISQNGKYYLYSRGAKQFVGAGGVYTDSPSTALTISSSSDTSYPWMLQFSGLYFNLQLANQNNHGLSIDDWDTKDGGNQFYIEEAAEVGEPEISYTEYNTVEPGSRPQDISMHSLWYDSPACKTGVSDTWMEYALPLGNGQMGATFRGGILKDELQLNEKTLWSGAPATWGVSTHGYYQNLGSLFVVDESGDFSKSDGTVPVRNYQRWLDIEKGLGGVRFEGTSTKYERLYLASLPDRCIAAQYKATGEKPLRLRFYFSPDTKINASTPTYSNAQGEYSGKPQTVSFSARFKVVTDGDVQASTAGISVSGNATYATVYICAATNFDPHESTRINGSLDDVKSEVQSRIDAVTGKDFASVEESAVDKHLQLMGETSLRLATVPSQRTTENLIKFYNEGATGKNSEEGHFLEQLYWLYGRYLSVAANADQTVLAPSNLQGIWNDRSNSDFWHCDIHADVNVQMNYWPVETGNLSLMHMPFLNWMMTMAREGSNWYTAADNIAGKNVRGWTVTTETDLLGGLSSWEGAHIKTLGAWYITHLWKHYRYTLDRDFLRQAFPVMLSGCQFLMDIAVKASDGTYELQNEYSPEHGPEDAKATAFAQQLAREACLETLLSYDILGLESGTTSADISELQDFYDNLDTGLRTETISGNTLLKEWKYLSQSSYDWNSHRHLSHLMCLYPLSQVSAYSTDSEGKALYQAAVKSLEMRGDAATGWSMGWKVNLWARALNGDHARLILSNALKHSGSYGVDMSNGGGCYYNLFDAHSPFQIDGNYGCTSGITEMLLQSYDGVALLPALPADWAEGRVAGLKAEGNFSVGMEWTDGKLTTASIQSNAGGTLRLRLTSSMPATLYIYKNGEKLELAAENGVYTIETAIGDKVTLSCAEVTGVGTPAGLHFPFSEGTYDLSGRKLANPQHGINIQRSKKVIR